MRRPGPGGPLAALAALLILAGCSQKAAEVAPPPDGSGDLATAPFPDGPPPTMARPPAAAGDGDRDSDRDSDRDAGETRAVEVPAPAPVPTPVPAPAPGPQAPVTQGGAAGGALPWCDLVEERMPAEACATLGNVARGTGAFRTPERMRKGEQTSVTLLVSRTADSDAPSRALEGVPGKEGRFAPAVGRFIEASLIPGPGLAVEIDPATPALQDLYASDEALWRWTVTAVERGRHDLTIRTRVMTRRPDGSFAPRGRPFTDSRTVEVYVAGAAAIEETAKSTDQAVKAMTETTGSLTSLLTGLGALVAAAGALWLALRRFGKGKAGDS